MHLVREKSSKTCLCIKSLSCNDFFSNQDFDPLAEHRRAKISDRESEYMTRRRQMIISPERHDPFADGEYFS